MLTYGQFIKVIINDLKEEFSMAELEDNILSVGSSITHVCLSVQGLYKEYQLTNGMYKEILNSTIKVVKDTINRFLYKINYACVYPLIKKNDYGKDMDTTFYRKPLWCDLDTLWVEDHGSTFRFVQLSDTFDEERLLYESTKNLSKLNNILKKLDDSLDIYSFYYSSDYCSSLLLDHKTQKSISRISKDILICVPSNSTVFVCKYTKNPDTIDILERLMDLDQDPNKVSSNIYALKDGEISIVNKKKDMANIHLVK